MAHHEASAWLVRAGRGAAHVDAFLDGGFVSIGWARINGLRDLRAADAEEMLDRLRAAQRGQPREDLRELLAFRDGMSRGDVVVTPDTRARVVLVGEITGGYDYAPRPVVADHRHVRRTAWQGRWPKDDLPAALQHTVRYYQRTVLELPHRAQWLALTDRVRAGGGLPTDLP